MREAYEIIIAPIVTEKATRLTDEQNVYVFLVHNSANKVEIAKAVEQVWDVKVEDVRTMRYAGKARRSMMGRMSPNRKPGRQPSYKKAMVRLAEGDHIELYEAG
ncbi:MAG: 50S ribosomal protein L23 [Gemmatimonadota bacterium]